MYGSDVLGAANRERVQAFVQPYAGSGLERAVNLVSGELKVIKFISSRWASSYAAPAALRISATPAQTWGTATYVSPIAYPLSSALYGRAGIVASFDPTSWKIFDATDPAARNAYILWAQAQPEYPDLITTVHSTATNHTLRNRFRDQFKIDCVLFHPDQEADMHTDRVNHIWMAVSEPDIDPERPLESKRFVDGRLTVLIDEEFPTDDDGLPIRLGRRLIEPTTLTFPNRDCIAGPAARANSLHLASQIAAHFDAGDSYLHVFIEP